MGAFAALTLFAGTFFVMPSGIKVAVIAWVSFAAMVLGGVIKELDIDTVRSMVWASGLSGGAALASVFYFILPQAFNLSPEYAATGVVAGFLSGLFVHSSSHRFLHSHSKGRDTLISVSLHSVVAGVVIGMIYQQMPGIGLTLGFAIVSHKLPAGFMIADRIKRENRDFWIKLLLPAAGLGATAQLIFVLPITLGMVMKAVFFGFSAGIFLHVALDFIPNPEPESNLRKLLEPGEDPVHDEMDEWNADFIFSTVIGALVVLGVAFLI